MHDLSSHLRKAVRQLRRNPGFSLTAILTLAIGIGATTAIFSIFYAVLLRPLPYADAGRLVDIVPMDTRPGGSAAAEDASYPNFRDWRAQAHSFDAIASYHTDAIVLNSLGTGAARNLQAGVVSSDFFTVLRISPVLGRSFLRDEEKAGARVVVLSHALWVSDFHSSPDVIGKSIKLSDELYTVVGVLPASASFPFISSMPIELWTTPVGDAIGKNPSTEQRGWNQLNVVARLKAGVTLAQAEAEMTTIVRRLAVQYPDDDVNETAVKITPTLEHMVGDVRPALRILLTAVCALLLIACANVAGLLLARGSSRQTELAVRAALGASRAEITMQLLSESVVLSLLGGVGGIAVALLALKGMLQFVPKNLPRLDGVAINGPILIFAIVVSALTGIVFGLLPARRLARLDPALALRDGARTSTAGKSQHRLHSVLVIGETAAGLVLLVGAGLLIHSFIRLMGTDPGFNPQHVLTFRAAISDKAYPDEKRLQFYDQLLARLQALPGTQSATAAYPLPFSGSGMELTFSIQEHPTKPSDQPDARASVVEPDYFETLQIPLKQGRVLTVQDNQEKAPPVMVINEALAQKYFPHEDPIGKRIQTAFDGGDDGKPGRWREIVGVVADSKRYSVSELPRAEYYVPYAQGEVVTPYLALRVTGDAASYAQTVTRAVADLDMEVPVYRVRTLDEGVAVASAQPRFQTMLLTCFAAVALLLAAIGLYAVLSYMVAQRTHELGLRMALGAQRGNVLGLVMRRGLNLTLVGLAIGGAASVVLTRFVAKMLYGVHALDPVTYISVAAILLVVSALASLVPAARAASLDPMRTLRNQ
jgi:putative ABC transport system permease protein